MVDKEGNTRNLADKEGEGRFVPLLRNQSHSILGPDTWRLLLFRAGNHDVKACSHFAHLLGHPLIVSQVVEKLPLDWLRLQFDPNGVTALPSLSRWALRAHCCTCRRMTWCIDNDTIPIEIDEPSWLVMLSDMISWRIESAIDDLDLLKGIALLLPLEVKGIWRTRVLCGECKNLWNGRIDTIETRFWGLGSMPDDWNALRYLYCQR